MPFVRHFRLLQVVRFPTAANQREAGYHLEPVHAARARGAWLFKRRKKRTSERYWSGNMLQFHHSCFFLLFFLSMSVMNTMLFNRSHYLTIRKWLFFPKAEAAVEFFQVWIFSVGECVRLWVKYTLNSEAKALTGDKSEGTKSRGAAEAFIRGFSPVKAEGEEFNVLTLSYTRELSRPFEENKG